MYEELLNFLLARKKNLLSEEEADRLMELIAQSMDIEADYMERTDNTVLIKKILDNVDVKEMIDEESDMRDAIDDLLFDECSSDDIDCDMIALYGGEDNIEPLSRRKFRRGVAFSGKGVSTEQGKKTIGIKDDNINKKKYMSEGSSSKKIKVDEAVRPADTEVLLDSDAPDKDFSENNDTAREFKLPGLDRSCGTSLPTKSVVEFRLPTTDQDGEFSFDLGELKDVKTTGSDFRFFDEDGKEL